MILLILFYSRGKKCSLQKLHVLNWAAKSPPARAHMSEYLQGNRRKDELVPRVDPSLNRAVDFAIGEGLVSIENGKSFRLTESGEKLSKEVVDSGDCLVAEIAFLAEVAKQATEQKVESLLTWSQLA